MQRVCVCVCMFVQAQQEKRDDLLAEVEMLRHQLATLAPSTAVSPTSSGRAGSPAAAGRLPAVGARRGKLERRGAAAKSPPVRLQVASTTCCMR